MSTQKENKSDYALKMVRAIRICEKAGVSSEICHLIKNEILNNLQNTQQPASTEQYLDNNSEKKADHYELKIRQLVQVDAPWDKIADIAWKYYNLKPTSEVAAHLLELSYLYGNEDDLHNTLKLLCANDLKFYGHVNQTVRNQIIKSNWESKIGKFLAPILAWQREATWLMPSERLFIVKNFGKNSDPNHCLQYFKKYQNDILKGVISVGETVKITASDLYLQLAHYAITVGKEEEACTYLKCIKHDDKAYHIALNLMLTSNLGSKSIENFEYTKLLFSESKWEKRIELFKNFFQGARTKAKVRDENRYYLNILLQDPLKWMPQTPVAWNSLSKLLIKNLDLAPILPEMKNFFEKKSLCFYSKTLDLAIWQPILDNISSLTSFPYFIGIAYIHQYIANIDNKTNTITSRDTQQLLWSAKKFIEKSESSEKNSDNLTWNQVHTSLTAWLKQNNSLSSELKDRAFRQLSICKDYKNIPLETINEYLKTGERLTSDTLVNLEMAALYQNATNELLHILLEKGQWLHFVNADLKKIREIALSKQNNDLAWRACSIMKSRKVLETNVSSAWEVSGENRKMYPITVPENNVLSVALTGFNQVEKKFCIAIIKSSNHIPTVIAKLNHALLCQKKKASAKGSYEARIESKLNQSPFFDEAKKGYIFTWQDEYTTATKLPPFAKRLPNNHWSQILTKVIERLGVECWNWKLSQLQKYLDEILISQTPKELLRNYSTNSANANGSLKLLAGERKRAIADLKLLTKKLSEPEAAFCLAKFLCRLTTIMYPNHHLALSTIQNMRSPLPILWDLERWILSDEYGAFRKNCGLRSMVPFPNNA
ncbi:MAG: hypothetical protein R3B45_01900 [Bdellovibrionota bacterium]